MINNENKIAGTVLRLLWALPSNLDIISGVPCVIGVCINCGSTSVLGRLQLDGYERYCRACGRDIGKGEVTLCYRLRLSIDFEGEERVVTVQGPNLDCIFGCPATSFLQWCKEEMLIGQLSTEQLSNLLRHNISVMLVGRVFLFALRPGWHLSHSMSLPSGSSYPVPLVQHGLYVKENDMACTASGLANSHQPLSLATGSPLDSSLFQSINPSVISLHSTETHCGTKNHSNHTGEGVLKEVSLDSIATADLLDPIDPVDPLDPLAALDSIEDRTWEAAEMSLPAWRRTVWTPESTNRHVRLLMDPSVKKLFSTTRSRQSFPPFK